MYDYLELTRPNDFVFGVSIYNIYLNTENGEIIKEIEYQDLYPINDFTIIPSFGKNPNIFNPKQKNYFVGLTIIGNNMKKLYFDFFGDADYNANDDKWIVETNMITDLFGNQFNNNFIDKNDIAVLIYQVMQIKQQYNVL